jgi:hypothetical protein
MPWFHGTVRRRFAAGEIVRPGREVGMWSNWSVHEEHQRRELASGRVVHPQDVVWVSDDEGEALSWAEHSTLKALPSEIRQMPAHGYAVYEVEPFEMDAPVEQHAREGAFEACCARARVIREVRFDAWELDLCDECGEKATTGLGTDKQLCTACAAEEA